MVIFIIIIKCKINHKILLVFQKFHFLKLRYLVVAMHLNFRDSTLKVNKTFKGKIYKLRSKIFITE